MPRYMIKRTDDTYSYTHLTHSSITGQATECREQCAQELYREIKDPAKMTNAKIDLVERGLGAKRAHAKSQSVMMMERVCVHAGQR